MMLGCGLLATSCGAVATAPAPPTAQKTGTAQIRHDFEPLTKRFLGLGAPVSATWMSGTFGDPRVPGPSTYWIDAVVQLRPEQATDLRAQFAVRDDGRRPDVALELRRALPTGALLTGADLDRAWSSSGWAATVYIAEGSPTVVVTARGE